MSVYLCSFLLVNRPRANTTATTKTPMSPNVFKKLHVSLAALLTTRSHGEAFRSTATGTLIVSVLTAALYTVSTRHLTLSLSRHTSLVLYTVSPFAVTLTITESLTRAVSLTVLTACTVSTL